MMKKKMIPGLFAALALGVSSAAWAAGSGASSATNQSAQTAQSQGTQSSPSTRSGTQSGTSGQSSGSTSGAGSATTTGATGAQAEQQARTLLQSQGYSNITELQRQQGGMFEAKADKGGQDVQVTVDLSTGRVMEK